MQPVLRGFGLLFQLLDDAGLDLNLELLLQRLHVGVRDDPVVPS